MGTISIIFLFAPKIPTLTLNSLFSPILRAKPPFSGTVQMMVGKSWLLNCGWYILRILTCESILHQKNSLRCCNDWIAETSPYQIIKK